MLLKCQYPEPVGQGENLTKIKLKMLEEGINEGLKFKSIYFQCERNTKVFNITIFLIKNM